MTPPRPEPGETTLTVWLYDSPMGALAGEVRLKDVAERQAISVIDAVTVSWLPGAHEPRVGHLRHHTAAAASEGAVLGALVGALLLTPVVGAATGAGVAGVAARLRGTGIDHDLLARVRAHLEPGRSALVVLSSDADLDVVRGFVERGLARGDVVLAHARLRDDAPAALRDALADLRPGGGDRRGDEASGDWPVPGDPRAPGPS